jgi:hypothetical protein
MREILSSPRMRHALLMLETAAAHAGCAMGCPFGSAAEFEAAMIVNRRTAWAYRRRRRWSYVCAIGVAGVMLAAFVSML